MPVEQQRAAVAADQALWLGVLGGLDELDAPFAHALQLLRIERRALQRIRQQLQHQCVIARQKLAVHQHRFAVRTAFEAPARTLDRFGKGIGIPAAGATREHLGRDAGDAGAPGRVETSAATHHRFHRNQRHVVPRQQDQPGAVGQADTLVRWNPHAACASGSGLSSPTVRRSGANTARATSSSSAPVTLS